MTKLLEKVMNSIGALSPDEQDAMAQILLEELESERLWDDRFAQGHAGLGKLADRGWSEHEAGKTIPLDPDRL